MSTANTRSAYISRLVVPRRWGDYRVHQRVAKTIPGRAVYRRVNGAVLVVSEAPPGAEIDHKPYAPLLEVGDRLRFVLRADVSRVHFVRGRRGDRYDPVIAARSQHPERPLAEIALELGLAWLARQGERHGFAIESTFQSDYRPISLVRKANQRHIRLPAIDFEGILRVTNSPQLASALIEGLGRGKAFGLGLLLVRRV